jgi:hypothetical protein
VPCPPVGCGDGGTCVATTSPTTGKPTTGCVCRSGWQKDGTGATTAKADVEQQGGYDDSATNLQACIGDCDSDGQCAAGLKCFQRDDGYTAIPGCTGQGNHNWDYCFLPPPPPSPGSCDYCVAGKYKTSAPSAPVECTLCPVGFFCPGGAAVPNRQPCPATRYGSITGLSTSACTGLCDAGYDGTSIGSTASTCDGACTQGWYCQQGVLPKKCGNIGVFCPTGASTPTPVADHHYSTPAINTPADQRTGENMCTDGYKCQGGVRTMCIAGEYCKHGVVTSCVSVAPGSYCEKGVSAPQSCLAG